MSLVSPSGIAIADECITAFKSLYPKGKAGTTRFVIYKVSDDQTTVEVEETSTNQDYEVFRRKLTSQVDSNGCPCARYAAYGVEFDLGQDGKRFRPVLITWVPEDIPIRFRMIYGSTMEQLRHALGSPVSLHADRPEEIEWRAVLEAASNGKVKA